MLVQTILFSLAASLVSAQTTSVTFAQCNAAHHHAVCCDTIGKSEFQGFECAADTGAAYSCSTPKVSLCCKNVTEAVTGKGITIGFECDKLE